MSETGVVTLYATFPDATVAHTIVTTLVTERLVACANLLPDVTSVFHWDGKVQSKTEAAALLKTSAGSADRAIARIKALHPDAVPCITMWPVENGYAPYLRWVKDQLV
jgi:periplasmic divalent cation tolerance protein